MAPTYGVDRIAVRQDDQRRDRTRRIESEDARRRIGKRPGLRAPYAATIVAAATNGRRYETRECTAAFGLRTATVRRALRMSKR